MLKLAQIHSGHVPGLGGGLTFPTLWAARALGGQGGRVAQERQRVQLLMGVSVGSPMTVGAPGPPQSLCV